MAILVKYYSVLLNCMRLVTNPRQLKCVMSRGMFQKLEDGNLNFAKYEFFSILKQAFRRI